MTFNQILKLSKDPKYTSPEIGSPTGLCWRRKLARWQSHTTSEPQTPPDELEPARSEAKLRRVLVEPVSLNQHKAKHLTRLYNRAINKPPGEHSFAVYCGSDHLTKIKLMLPMLFQCSKKGIPPLMLRASLYAPFGKICGSFGSFMPPIFLNGPSG